MTRLIQSHRVRDDQHSFAGRESSPCLAAADIEMAGHSKPLAKKQVSLTNFFTPKTVNGLSAAFQRSQEDAAATKKRPLQEDKDNGNESPDKRVRRSKEHAGSTQEASSSPPGDARRPQAPQRTQRFAYDAPTENGDNEGQDEEDAAYQCIKKDLHRRFVEKLGHPDSMARIKRRNFQIDEETEKLDGEDGEEDDDNEEAEAPTTVRGNKKGQKANKLTPMEIQYLDIKRKNPDTVLIVEVGYKFKFFGEDARIAAKELSIVCIPGKLRYDEHPSEAHIPRFASASVPVHRLHVHAKRLVAAGHKVGVVRQIETAALKKVGDNRNTPFTRKLTNVYTKGTYIDEVGELNQSTEASGAPSGGYLLCITESGAKGAGTDEKVDVGILAVQPATGDIIYDNFEDGFMRSDIETRLLHISPCELLIVGDLTKATEKMVRHLSGSATNVFGDRTRVERVPKSKTMAAEAYSHVTRFYAEKLRTSSRDEAASALLDKVLKLPEPVTICLSAMITHLTEYGLQHIFDLTKYFQSFSTRQHMLINGTTLESLEVYRNATDHTEKASLFWAMDKTKTRFGQRLLRKWLGKPLLDQERLEERVNAVEELFEGQNTPKVDKVEHLLRNVKTDLERSLIRIYYGKCTRPELLGVLQTLQRIAFEYHAVVASGDTGFTSKLIADALCALPTIGDIVVSHLDKISAEAARRDDKYGFFREAEETDDISTHKLGIAAVEQELDAHRAEARQQLSRKNAVEYATVAGIEYLIEVPKSELEKVPASWAKISGTKKLSRFHTPEVRRLISERDQHREALAAACDDAFKTLLASIAEAYQPLRDAVAALATLDCLLSLSQVASLPGYCKPTFLPADTPPTISITGGRHPIAEHTLPGGYIPFSTSLTSPAPLAHLITGPNMGGKSSFVRAVALLTLLAQVGSFVPADAMSLTPTDAIHTRMGARDNLFKGESTFMVELSETAAILATATPRSLVILDELGRGTSTHDGAAIASAVLEHVARETRCLTLFITHYQNLARVADGLDGRVRNVHMRFATNEGEHEGEEEITFLYEVAEGVAHRSYGLNVARLARVPRRVLDVAAEKSGEMEEAVMARRLGGAASLLGDVMRGEDALDQLVASIEQL
jgi:DNA mismatch repair protein MSH3